MKYLMGRLADFFRETDKLLLILCVTATSYGCLAVFSTTYHMESIRRVIVQAFCMIIGIIAALIISTYDYEKIMKRWYIWAVVGVLPVIFTFFIGFAPEGTDDKAWLDLGITTFQPSELMKICFIITFATHIRKVKENINKPKYFIPLCLHGFFPVGLIFLQGDWGTAIVFGVITVFMMWAGGVSWKYFLSGISAALIASPFGYFFVLSDDHRKRLAMMLDIEGDIQGIGFQQWRGRVALANGGLFGQGFLNGDLTQSASIPESHNDFIFVCIGEEFGLLGCLVVIILLGAICLRCMRVARICINDGGKLICVGVFAMLFTQSVINIGMCTSLLPVIGITLPFFSAGGTSLLCLFLGIGLVFNVYKHRNSRIIYLRD